MWEEPKELIEIEALSEKKRLQGVIIISADPPGAGFLKQYII